ncbi:hypothetical protein [Glycomyces sp. MUSA5-2]|uniref:hypothetical protein n=1 Tax=Glycomyces sp. MUSA5-2 TaxID=2053002 RepID=UPI0030092038
MLAARLAALVSVVLAAAACTDAASDDASTPTDDASSASAAPVPPEAIEDPEAAAIAAYTRYWDTLTAAAAAPDGDYSEFDAISADQALEYAVAIESEAFENGNRMIGTVGLNPSVKDAVIGDDLTQVIVRDCADTSGMQTLNQDGEPVAGESYGPQEVQARVELIAGMWIITVLAIQEVGSCVPDD